PYSNVVRKVDTNGTITTVAGNTIAGSDGGGGPATDASLNTPTGLFADASGNLYIADTGNHSVRLVAAGFGTITTVTTAADLTPRGITRDSAGNLFIADSAACTIKKFDGSAITTFAGTTGTCGYSDGGPTKDPKQAALNVPTGVALDSGNLYIAEQRNCIVRKVTAGSTPTITIVAGTAPMGDFFPTPVCTSDQNDLG